MDDGTRTTNCGFYFCTEGFNFNENYLLAAMLHYQFGLYTTVEQSKPRIRIRSKSMPLFISIVTPHFHHSMKYKLKTK